MVSNDPVRPPFPEAPEMHRTRSHHPQPSSAPSTPPSRPRMKAPIYGDGNLDDEAVAHTDGDRSARQSFFTTDTSHPHRTQSYTIHVDGYKQQQQQQQQQGYSSSSDGTPMTLNSFVSQHLSNSGRGNRYEDGGNNNSVLKGRRDRLSLDSSTSSSLRSMDEARKRCRICFETQATGDPELGRLISPCQCKGSSKYIHLGCLEKWQQMSPRPSSQFQCDICHYQYSYSRPKIAAVLEKSWFAPLFTVLATVLIYYLLALLGHALNSSVWQWKPVNELTPVLGIDWMDLIFAVFAGLILTCLSWIIAIIYRWILKSLKHRRRILRRRRRDRAAMEQDERDQRAITAVSAGSAANTTEETRTSRASGLGIAAILGISCCSGWLCCESSIDDDIEAAVLRNGEFEGDDEGSGCSSFSDPQCCYCPCYAGGGDCGEVAFFMFFIVGILVVIGSLYLVISHTNNAILAKMKTTILEVK